MSGGNRPIPFVSNKVSFGTESATTRARITLLTGSYDISEIAWLNVTNGALGIAVAVFLGLIGIAVARDLLPRLSFWLYGKQMDAEVRRLLSQYRI